MSVGLVVGGGGARGAFAVGAIDHLFSQGIYPEIVAGTSAGALTAAKVAEARTPEEFRQAARELRKLAVHITRPENVFEKQPWLATLDGTPLGDRIDALMGFGPTSESRSRLGAGGGRASGMAEQVASVMRRVPDASRSLRSIRGHARALMTTRPLGALLRGGPGRPGLLDPARIAQPGLTLRLTAVSLEAGKIRYVTESGALIADDGLTVLHPSGYVDVIDGVLASAAVPGLFEPVRLGDETYVDGAARSEIPVDAALAAGAERVYTIVNVPVDPRPAPRSYADADLVSVMLRVFAELMPHEVQHSNLRAHDSANVPCTAIVPTVRVQQMMEIDPGLIAINLDYGYLRAADEVDPRDERTRRLAHASSDAIVRLRIASWREEQEVLVRPGEPVIPRPSPSELSHARLLKWLLGRLLARRAELGVASPPDAGEWHLRWEHHERHVRPEVPWTAEEAAAHVPPDALLVETETGERRALIGGRLADPASAGDLPVREVPFGVLSVLDPA